MTVLMQGDLFDQDAEPDSIMYRCALSGYTWAKGISTKSHHENVGFDFGACRCQGTKLFMLHIRRTQWGFDCVRWEKESDLLWLILDAKQHGCTDADINNTLVLPWDYLPWEEK